MIRKIRAKKEDCVLFYCIGWRYGKIIEKQSNTRMTVKDCTGEEYQIVKNDKDRWGVVGI